MYGLLYGVESVVIVPENNAKLGWILKSGWEGLCPRCGKGHMFRSWLKVSDKCEMCGLDYRFAAPDDGPAFFSLCIVAFPLVFLIVWLQVAYDPPFWVHLVSTVPAMVLGCLLPLRPIKGWLVASQYVNRAQEAGTERLWAQLHGRDYDPRKGDFDD
jgi:uncharacterized protein (DUF983 family)